MFPAVSIPKGVILSVAVFQAERELALSAVEGILRVPGKGFGEAPREIPHPAEERRVSG